MHLESNLSKKIITWYDNNKRDLPWRVNYNSKKKLYYRLLSEFMLQQTQVNTVIPYFNKFIKKYPDIYSLSESTEREIMKSWEGLGYYRRAKNLLKTAKILVKKKGCQLPENAKELRSLPGIGEYTSNVLLALVYNKPKIALDTNVKRFFSRILNIEKEKVDYVLLIKKNKKFFFRNRNADLVEALIEFGALICKAKDPKCKNCILKNNCLFFKTKNEIKHNRVKKRVLKKYDIFCYLNKKKQIALTKKNKVGFLNNSNLPIIKNRKINLKKNNWKFLKNYKGNISNKNLDINLYYKFTNRIPKKLKWYNIRSKREFMPSFTKNIIYKISNIFYE